jgi:hypothetical protein
MQFHGTDTPQQIFNDELYEIYVFLKPKTNTRLCARTLPPQGRWRIYGVSLPDGILKKVYYENAARLLGLKN